MRSYSVTFLFSAWRVQIFSGLSLKAGPKAVSRCGLIATKWQYLSRTDPAHQ